MLSFDQVAAVTGLSYALDRLYNEGLIVVAVADELFVVTKDDYDSKPNNSFEEISGMEHTKVPDYFGAFTWAYHDVS